MKIFPIVIQVEFGTMVIGATIVNDIINFSINFEI